MNRNIIFIGLCLIPLAACTVSKRKPPESLQASLEAADRDRDGIPNAADNCPGEAETANGYRDGDGCPDAIPPKPEFKSIHYGVNSKDVVDESKEVIAGAADILKKYPGIRIRIEGHTDSYGTPSYNLEISKRRADTIKTWLVQKHGIESTRIETAGFGMTKPVGSFDTREGRIANRRIEFIITDGWPPKE